MSTSRIANSALSSDSDEIFMDDESSDEESSNVTENNNDQSMHSLIGSILGVLTSSIGFSTSYYFMPDNLPGMYLFTLGFPLLSSAITYPLDEEVGKLTATVGMAAGMVDMCAYQLGVKPSILPDLLTDAILIACIAFPFIKLSSPYQMLSNHVASFWHHPPPLAVSNQVNADEKMNPARHQNG